MNTKLKSYFMLCSLTDSSKVWGVSKHPENDCIVVTSSQNMISRFKIAEQRPLSSWSSREGFSGIVMFDVATSQYAVVVAGKQSNMIRVWREEDQKLDKLKKYMFTSTIWGLVESQQGEVFVVFAGGHILPLQQALEERKQQFGAVLPEHATLSQCYLKYVDDKSFVVYVCCHAKQQRGCLVFVKDMTGDSNLREVSVTNEDLNLSGSTVCLTYNHLTMLSLWSDGTLVSQGLLEEGPVKLLGKVDGIEANKKVALISLSDNHVAVYAADASEEGATVAIYNTKFCLVQSKQRLKLYTSPPKMWGPFDNKLVLSSGGSLLVAPFVLGKETLASMVGSASSKKLSKETQHADWGLKTSEPVSFYSSAPVNLQASLQNLAKQGFSEAAICQKLLPILLEKKDVLGISWFLENITEIPESILARVVSFCLREKEGTFATLLGEDQRDVELEQDEPMDEISASLPPESPLGGGRLRLLNDTLHVAFNSSRLLPEVRQYLAPQDAMLIIRHCASRLWHGDVPHDDTEKDLTQLIQWCCVLLDANYQHCLLSMDTEVLHTLTTLSDIVDSQISNIDELRNLEPFIKRIKSGQELPQSKHGNQVYVIESIRLY